MRVALKAQPGVRSIDIVPVAQLVTIELAPGGTQTAEWLRTVIQAQGFATRKDPVVTVRGTLEGPTRLALGAGKTLALEGDLGPLRAVPPGAELTLRGTLLLKKASREGYPAALEVSSVNIPHESPSRSPNGKDDVQ